MTNELISLDMAGEDETTIALRLDLEIPVLAMSGAACVVLDLGDRPLQRATVAAVALAHRELRAVGGRLVVVTNPAGARQCARVCPEMMVAATTRRRTLRWACRHSPLEMISL
ncbi:MAG TPA: hypothetical protein VFX51_21290 [Solirubrobacteraceae bacterium]|nr:hypothetical protein [Solirubrobacteraceae bacterium]